MDLPEPYRSAFRPFGHLSIRVACAILGWRSKHVGRARILEYDPDRVGVTVYGFEDPGEFKRGRMTLAVEWLSLLLPFAPFLYLNTAVIFVFGVVSIPGVAVTVFCMIGTTVVVLGVADMRGELKVTLSSESVIRYRLKRRQKEVRG